MTDLEKQLRAANRPPYIAHAGGQTKTFTDVTSACHWCTLRDGFVKQRVAPGQYEIVFSARRSDRPGYPAKSLILP